mmetsp:Transcript_23525/g.50054  ORF Transcript_23525/g.50054 Transcript_23525/m.50054 type:complete len:537 (+) Transcript_23525:172-1782(+)|eukprot:CAMPEP_0201178288 /NCGR_PEP_ID=MMETSP0851-20130426/110095_1 /ASSEMBLY_ACC=CAM_ASM_000631 /TAXON_ID=183588 /ORGANISM="Pseudo-nitzschia fraudulenta, Strain WWA7" /LENGTH=536 /DNA_ID=CAMNT_0047462041 /DNA_START=327 /DNA_END=1937 /DNA_ORIENTATION=+
MEPCQRKKRQLLGEKPSTRKNAYRLHFSCEYIGKYFRSTKRRIRWYFGFRNGGNRGEEHEVELIWSVVSDKIKVFWNKTDVSHYTPDKRAGGKIDISWNAISGEIFRISVNESPPPSGPQYDLFIGSISIFSLLHVSELTQTTIIIDNLADYDILSETSMESSRRSEGFTGYDDETGQAHEVELRPSTGSFYSYNPLDEAIDDLTSSFSFTNILESLRGIVTSLIPNSEDSVSRSVIKALSEENHECSPHSRNLWDPSLIRTSAQMPLQIEANILLETIEWTDLHMFCSQDSFVQEQKLLFLQKQMDIVFVHARHERLTEEAAARILIDVTTLLDIPIYSSLRKERNTIIIRDLNKEIKLDTLTRNLIGFEELHEVGISSNHTFAFCRFASERGPLRVLAAVDKGDLMIKGRLLHVSLIQKPSIMDAPPLLRRRATSTPLQWSDSTIQRPIFTRRKSHQRNTISIDTLIVESPPFFRLINDSSIVSPLHVSPYAYQEKLEKINNTKDFNSHCDAFATKFATKRYYGMEKRHRFGST